jgi:hypothetical protein
VTGYLARWTHRSGHAVPLSAPEPPLSPALVPCPDRTPSGGLRPSARSVHLWREGAFSTLPKMQRRRRRGRRTPAARASTPPVALLGPDVRMARTINRPGHDVQPIVGRIVGETASRPLPTLWSRGELNPRPEITRMTASTCIVACLISTAAAGSDTLRGHPAIFISPPGQRPNRGAIPLFSADLTRASDRAEVA